MATRSGDQLGLNDANGRSPARLYPSGQQGDAARMDTERLRHAAFAAMRRQDVLRQVRPLSAAGPEVPTMR